MPYRVGIQKGRATQRRRTFLRQHREAKGLSLEVAASRLEMSAAQLSRIETGKSPYTQDFLELAAHAYQTDVASLLMRDPSDPEAIWSLWDQAKPGQREQIVEHAKVIVRSRTGT
jgi:transcriptional regulator with XRE-family HTH domain